MEPATRSKNPTGQPFSSTGDPAVSCRCRRRRCSYRYASAVRDRAFHRAAEGRVPVPHRTETRPGNPASFVVRPKNAIFNRDRGESPHKGILASMNPSRE